MTDDPVKYLRDMADQIENNVPHNWSYNKVLGEIEALQDQMVELNKRSGLMSKSWFTRAYTTWGYVIAAQLLIAVVLLVLGMIFGLLGN